MKIFALLLLLAVGLGGAPRHAAAGEPAPFEAHGGLHLAREAAGAWSRDAVIVYVENDEVLDAQGASARWSYLFYSPALDKLRFYSVRAGKILVAENLDLKFDAP